MGVLGVDCAMMGVMPATRKKTVTPGATPRDARNLLRSGEGARALQMLGDRWCLLILRDAFLGARRFEDFRRLTGAARGTLTQRLNLLVQQGVLYRNPYGRSPGRLEYRLTDKGMGFYPVALALWSWESRWAGEFGLPPALIHKRCGHAMQPEATCGHCARPIQPVEVLFEPGPGAKTTRATPVGDERRRRTSHGPHAAGVDTTMFHSIDTIGDRWSVLLLAALFFGLHRYDDIFAAMGIATNILSDRLQRFLSVGVIERKLYSTRPPRYEYRLTAKGWDLYPFAITLQDWGTTWLPTPNGPAIRLFHKPCNHALRVRMACNVCHEPIDPHEVGVQASRGWRATRRLTRPAAPAARKKAQAVRRKA